MKTNILTSLGINEKAAKMYLTALSLGTASLQKIAQKANIKRPTAYLHVEELLRDGLFETIPLGKKVYYRASDPKLLEKRAKENFTIIQNELPTLELLHGRTSGKPSVKILEGEKGMNDIYEEIHHANSIRFFADLQVCQNLFFYIFKTMAEMIGKNQIHTREIISNNAASKKSSKYFSTIADKYYSSRIAPQGLIYNDSAIYGNVVAFFRLHEYNLFVIRIEDATIAQSMKTLFDLAWESAIPFIPKLTRNNRNVNITLK